MPGPTNFCGASGRRHGDDQHNHRLGQRHAICDDLYRRGSVADNGLLRRGAGSDAVRRTHRKRRLRLRAATENYRSIREPETQRRANQIHKISIYKSFQNGVELWPE